MQDSDELVNVPLLPYPNPAKALEALTIMCSYLQKALNGDAHAREAVVVGWRHMVLEGMKLAVQDSAVQVALVSHLFGSGRIYDELNRKGTLQYFEVPPMDAMLDEALAA